LLDGTRAAVGGIDGAAHRLPLGGRRRMAVRGALAGAARLPRNDSESLPILRP